jgi:hypothetical protein
MVTPEIEADGQRESVNRKISVNQIVWNLRSAYTVAALDCQNPRNAAILPNYRHFLERNASVLKSVYDQMDHDFRQKYGRGGETLRDDYLTVLYNHYALPPTKDEFCDVVEQALVDGIDVAPQDLGNYAAVKVPLIEKVFDDFYDRYDKYRNALAEWEEKYGRVGRVSVEPLAQGTPAPPVPTMLRPVPPPTTYLRPAQPAPSLAVPEPDTKQTDLPPAIPEPQSQQPQLPPAIPEPPAQQPARPQGPDPQVQVPSSGTS